MRFVGRQRRPGYSKTIATWLRWDFKVQQRKDAYEVQHAANIPIIKKWMDNNTQADPSNTKVKHSNTRGHHRNNKGTKRRECVQPGACVERPLRYQVQTDGDWYLSFAEAHPDIAAVTSINVFLRFCELKPHFSVKKISLIITTV